MQTPSLFLCNELGPFQAISGDFKQFAWALFKEFQERSGKLRQF